jgi:FtsZ-binding cell division protein ZapB
MKMTVDVLMEDVKILKESIQEIKEVNKVLMDKLDKAYDDRIKLRADNFSMQNQLKEIANA